MPQADQIPNLDVVVELMLLLDQGYPLGVVFFSKAANILALVVNMARGRTKPFS